MPSRGQVFAKAAYRCTGTLAGAGFAFLIIPLVQHPVLYLGAVCAGVALCAFIACSLRRFRSYSAQLAGYTATIIGGLVLITSYADYYELAT